MVIVTCRSDMTGALGMADIRTTQFTGGEGRSVEGEQGVLKECVEQATLHHFVLDTKARALLNSLPFTAHLLSTG